MSNDTKKCTCGGVLLDVDGEWAGEINGSGTVYIYGCECIDCGKHYNYDKPIVLTGM
jgi:hypothetical protein